MIKSFFLIESDPFSRSSVIEQQTSVQTFAFIIIEFSFFFIYKYIIYIHKIARRRPGTVRFKSPTPSCKVIQMFKKTVTNHEVPTFITYLPAKLKKIKIII